MRAGLARGACGALRLVGGRHNNVGVSLRERRDITQVMLGASLRPPPSLPASLPPCLFFPPSPSLGPSPLLLFLPASYLQYPSIPSYTRPPVAPPFLIYLPHSLSHSLPPPLYRRTPVPPSGSPPGRPSLPSSSLLLLPPSLL